MQIWLALFDGRNSSAKAQRTSSTRQKDDVACIVYSSGTGGRPKGCVLTHENYLEQCRALTAWYPFWPGVRYLSILPTNHAIDFMVGFIGPFVCGACVVHLRTLRPEYVREAFVRYRITYVALVPMIVKNLESGLRAKFGELPSWKRALLNSAIAINRLLTRRRPDVKLSRMFFPISIADLAGNCWLSSPAVLSWNLPPCSSSMTSAFQWSTDMALRRLERL